MEEKSHWTNTYDSHGLIERYQKYFSPGSGIKMISYTDHEGRLYRVLPVYLQNIFNPWVMGGGVLFRRGTYVLREFLTIPFVVSLPINIFNRKRLVLVLVHNVQMAHKKRLHRYALRVLLKSGFRFISLESDSGIREIGFHSAGDNKVFALPLPMGGCLDYSKCDIRKHTSKVFKVGVVGNNRKEKDISRVICAISDIAERAGHIELVVGTSDEVLASKWASRGVNVVNTSSRDNYLKCLYELDILVVNYRAVDYYYRTSGVILDAISCGTLVVFPNYPVFHKQVCVPARFGAPFSDLSDLEAAINECISFASDKESAYAMHKKYRGRDGIKGCVQRLERALLSNI